MYKSKDCVSDRIKKVILQRVCDGIYSPGQRLVELQIAKEFETSQAPVREALSELEAMRIVETEPYKGTHVREISSKEWQECLEIRGALEQLAAERMADRLKNKIDELRQKSLETIEAARKHNVQDYGIANVAFHRMIVEASDNQTLMIVWESLAAEIRMRSSVYASAMNLMEPAEEHLEITEAFAEGDNRYAGKLLKKHSETILVGAHLHVG